jgi:hypothetical protein
MKRSILFVTLLFGCILNTCLGGTIMAGCISDEDCEDEDPCSIDSCSLHTSTCYHEIDPNCANTSITHEAFEVFIPCLVLLAVCILVFVIIVRLGYNRPHNSLN